MAKHRFQRTRKIQATRLLLFAALALIWGVPPSWAGQQSSQTPPPSPKTAQGAGRKMMAKPTPVRSAKTPAQRKGTAATSHSSPLAAGKRDPFKLPEVASAKSGAGNILESAPGGVLPQGKRGLLIAHLTLEGVVREQASNKMIAVVTNETKLAHFLYENDAVYNGIVSKITPDAVYFKENVLDASGRVTTREVVKRLGSAPGEGR
ncbi:MAG TPA: hypothetical protein VKO18_22465 [Terriglobia bacterium]|nr:hypothetical protein [Terriglobia bacterium]